MIRQALPRFGGLVDRSSLLGLATRSDAISRLVLEHPRRRQKWERHDGPFDTLDALPETHWTLLVHGVESLVAGGWELLREFSFVPAARIDDLMVSYAAPGGSVGPHDDLYDVFLLQGPGRRRWQISEGGDRALDRRLPHQSAAARLPAEEEWLLEPGDMLYLPPGVAHHGVAEGPCFTYSIGFHLRAVASKTWCRAFSDFSRTRCRSEITDALVQNPKTPAWCCRKIRSSSMTPWWRRVANVIGGIKWNHALVEDFLGCFLTRPKPHVIFSPPIRGRCPEEAFARKPSRARAVSRWRCPAVASCVAVDCS